MGTWCSYCEVADNLLVFQKLYHRIILYQCGLDIMVSMPFSLITFKYLSIGQIHGFFNLAIICMAPELLEEYFWFSFMQVEVSLLSSCIFADQYLLHKSW